MKVTLDARDVVRGYQSAFGLLRQLPGFKQSTFLRAEAGSLLKQWAGLTKVTTQEQADYRARYRAGKRAFGDVGSVDRNPYRISVNTGLRGGYPGEVWFKTRGGFSADQKASRKKQGKAANGVFQQAGRITNSGQFIPAWIHYRANDWDKIASGAQLYAMNLAEQLRIGRESVGFARQSVVQIADQLGIDLIAVKGRGVSPAGIRKARAAIASNGKSYVNGSGTQGGDEVKFYVSMFSRLQFGHKIGMDRDLLSVINGRRKFIETAYRKGAFDSMKSAARAFPNLVSTASLN